VDVLHFLANYPEQALRVHAVVSVVGAVNGSPLAETAAIPYAMSAAYVPLPRCASGNHLVIEDLRPSNRLRWLATHRLPSHIRYFSLVAFTERSRMARALSLTAHILGSRDPRNDGQILASDAIIPGSTVLGYANADHRQDIRSAFRTATSRSARVRVLKKSLCTLIVSVSY
jgi:hypothetical protein